MGEQQGLEAGDTGREARRLSNSRGITVQCDNASINQPQRGADEGPPPSASEGPVTTRRGGGGQQQDGLWRGRGGWKKPKSSGCRHEAPRSPVPRALGGDSWPDRALRRTPRNPLTFLPGRARQETTCEGRPERPRQLLGTAPQSAERPAPPLTSPGSRNHFPRGEEVGEAAGGSRGGRERWGAAGSTENGGSVLCSSAADSRGSGRHAEVRLHLEDEATAEPRGSASTSRGSLLTLHCEEAAAEEAAPSPAPAQSPAAAEWPPASPQDPPPRLRRAAHRARRAQHGQLRQPHAAVRNSSGGRGAAPFVSTAKLLGRGPVCTGWPARLPGQARGGERSPVPVWRSLLSTPTRLPLHAGGAAAPAATAAAAAAAEARAAAAAALAGRGHVTQPAGSLGAGKRARARRKRGWDRD
ncbi:transcription initiation factor TFIID subunit 4-like [Mustela erminea]|uniref:transcription initiation factor TFIID subunit 4-like n=1 Tax=Mustela erminea TaxID=36723 RepID=UPI0013868178|nr:transcription initiation factor TFIID subunit 4-like [Mustela erminea]